MTTRTRAGFTLIELLVVIAILAALAALSAGTYFRVRSAQQVTATESTLQKLNTGIERLYSAVRDQADKEITTGALPNSTNSTEKLLHFCGGLNQKERARAIWLYFRIKNEFPQTFNECVTPTTLIDPTIPAPGYIVFLPRKETFRRVPSIDATFSGTLTNDDYNLQAAALLYLILTEKTSRGEVFDDDALRAFIVEKPVRISATQTQDYKVFVDSWGTPITFSRFFSNGELSDRPYAKFNKQDYFTNQNICNNPIDPNFRLFSTRTTNGVTETWAKFNIFQAQTGFPATTNGARDLQLTNWLPTAISAGANKSWDGFNVCGTAVSPFNSIGIVVDNADRYLSDNILGYRLRQFGNRGD